MPILHSASITDSSSEDSSDSSDLEAIRDPKVAAFRVSQAGADEGDIKPTSAPRRVHKYSLRILTCLTTSPKWDKVVTSTGLSISSRGLDALRCVLDQAPFVRSRLPKTSSCLRKSYLQEAAAIFCITKITDLPTPNDLRMAFAELLPNSLTLAGQSPELSVRLRNLQASPNRLFKRLPLQTQHAITDYLSSQNPTTPSQTTQTPTTVSPVQSSQSTAPKSSTLSYPRPTAINAHSTSAAIGDQAPPRTVKIAQRPSTTSPPRSSTSSRTQPVPRASQKAPTTKDHLAASPARPFLSPAPKSSAPPKPKPPTTPTSTFQKAETTLGPSASALKTSTPSRIRPLPSTSQRAPAAPDTSSVSVTQPSPSSAPKSSTPSEPRPSTTISQKAATSPGPSWASAHKVSTPSRTRPPPSTSQRTPTAQDTSIVSITRIPLGSAPRSSSPSEPQPSSSAVQDALIPQLPLTTPESASNNLQHTPNPSRDPKRRKRRKK